MKSKIGVLLLQLGTPDDPSVSSVRKYLKQFLNDPRVIDIPYLLRKILVNLIIVPFRAPKSAKIYKELWDYGNGVSPLIYHSEQLRKELQKKFSNENVHVRLAMRYKNPSMPSVLNQMKNDGFDHIIILPLFPQYASASSGSAIEHAMMLISKWWVIPQLSVINQFYTNEGYLNSIVERARVNDLSSFDHVVFSYHGLPERQVDKVYEADDLCRDEPCETEINDQNKLCYKATCYATTRLLADKLKLNKEKYTVAFQSRLDKKWLTPFSDEIVAELAKNGCKRILVFSPAFVADCLETIIEIGSEYQEIFEENGGEEVVLVESNNTHPLFIDGMESLIRSKF